MTFACGVDSAFKLCSDFFALTVQRLMSLLALYQQPETPYTACPFTGHAPDYNDYAHLERIAEWQVEENDDEKE